MDNSQTNKKRKANTYSSLNSWAKIGIGVLAALVTLVVINTAIVAYAKVTMPTWGDETTTQQVTNAIKANLNPKDPAFMSGLRGLGAGIKKTWKQGKIGNLGTNIGQETDRIQSGSSTGGGYIQAKRYNKAFDAWNNKKHVKIGLNGNWLTNANQGNTTLDSIGRDNRLTNKENANIQKYIKTNFSKWAANRKKHGKKLTRAAAEAEVMNLTGDAYNKYLKNDKKRKKILEQINKDLGKSSNNINKGNNEQSKNVSGANSEPSTFSGKVAKALLDLFYSSGIGQWMAKSGAGATIFGINYTAGTSGPQMYSEIANAYNANGYAEIYPNSAYTQSIQGVGVVIGPVFLALSAVLIMIILIIQTTKMGVGQAFNPVESRREWYRSLVDTVIAVVGCLEYNLLISVILSVNGAIVTGLAGFMAQTTTSTGNTILSEAVTLGFSKTTINMLTSGTFLGSDFVGIIFSVIYLMTYIGLAVYIKYYYFVREVVFTILWALGPVFIAFWPSDWGKIRTVNWLREIIGTVMMQSIHAITITFMAVLMAWNSDNWSMEVADIKSKSKLEAGGQTLHHSFDLTTSGHPLGAAGDAIKGLGQFVGIVGPGVDVSNAYKHFETMVIGFIIMVMFQPLSKALADLFGLQTHMLDEIHRSTSHSLKAGAAVAGGVAIGAAGLALGTATGGVSALAGSKALMSAGKAAKAAKAGAKTGAFKKAFGKSWNQKTPINEMRDKLAGVDAKVRGMAGRSVGEVAGMSAGLGAGDPATAIAMSRLGGEIGSRAARLTSGSLSKLALKEADPNRDFKDELRRRMNGITDKATSDALKRALDKSPGYDTFIQKAKAAPDYDNNAELKQAVADADAARQFEKHGGLDADQAIQARAKRLRNGKNNYKSLADINKAYREAIDNDSSLTPQQKEAAEQIGDQAMILAGAPANDSHIMMDKMGFLDAQHISQATKQKELNSLESKYNNGAIPNTDPTQMSFADWQKTDQYQKGYKPGIDAKAKNAAQAALNNSNGRILNSVNDSSFQQGIKENPDGIINSDIFKSEAVKGLKKAGIPTKKATNLGSVADPIEGQSLTETAKSLAGDGATAQIIDSGLWNQLNQQRANTINSGWGGMPKVTAQDLDSIYNGENMNAYGGLIGDAQANPNAQDIDYYVNNADKASYYDQSKRQWAEFKDMTTKASKAFDPLNLGSWFGNVGLGSNSSKTSSATYGTNAVGFNDDGSMDRITNNPYLHPQSHGLSLKAAYAMMPKILDSREKPIGVQPGAFRMAIQNTQSTVQAQDENGNWFNVGKFGPGDGTLGYGDTVYQDMDMSASGRPSLAYNASTHSISEPYRIQDGQRVGATLTNGIPNLSNFFGEGNLGSQAQTAPGDFAHLPQSNVLTKANQADGVATVDKYLGYSGFALQGNKDTMVVTGVNPYTGVREALSNETKSNPFLKSLPEQTNFSIPLKSDDLNGFNVDTSKDYQLFFNGNMKQNEKELSSKIMSDFYNDNHRVDDADNFLQNRVMPYTERDVRNFKANHTGYLSGTNLDAFFRTIW